MGDGQGADGRGQVVRGGQAVGAARKIIAFADTEAATWFTGKSWMAEALRVMWIETMVVELPEELRVRLRAAQARQFRSSFDDQCLELHFA